MKLEEPTPTRPESPVKERDAKKRIVTKEEEPPSASWWGKNSRHLSDELMTMVLDFLIGERTPDNLCAELDKWCLKVQGLNYSLCTMDDDTASGPAWERLAHEGLKMPRIVHEEYSGKTDSWRATFNGLCRDLSILRTAPSPYEQPGRRRRTPYEWFLEVWRERALPVAEQRKVWMQRCLRELDQILFWLRADELRRVVRAQARDHPTKYLYHVLDWVQAHQDDLGLGLPLSDSVDSDELILPDVLVGNSVFRREHFDSIPRLLRRGLDPDLYAVDDVGRKTPLLFAVMQARLEASSVALIKYRADLSYRWGLGQDKPLLTFACDLGMPQTFAAMLAANSTAEFVNSKDSEGFTAAFYAGPVAGGQLLGGVNAGDTELLMDNDEDAQFDTELEKDPDAPQPYYLAKLKTAGADFSIRVPENPGQPAYYEPKTMLQYAARNLNVLIVRFLLEKGGLRKEDVNATNRVRRSALFLALNAFNPTPAMYDKMYDVADLLLNAGADPNIDIPFVPRRIARRIEEARQAQAASPVPTQQ